MTKKEEKKIKKSKKNKNIPEKSSQDTIEIEKYYEMEDRYKRALADYQNFQKRSEEDKKEFMKYANEQLLYEILPVYDNLKMSLLHIKDSEENAWLEGIKYVIQQFKEVLKNAGVEEIETKNKKFDPLSMEAVEGKGDQVKKEIKPGYKLNGKVIIAAKVSLK